MTVYSEEEINVGDTRKLTGDFYDEDGVLADPTQVTFKVQKPTETTPTSYIYGTAPEVIKSEIGKYYMIVDLDTPGRWYYLVVGTGTVPAMEEESFFVEYSTI